MKKLLFRPKDLNDFMVRFLTRLNVPETDAEIAADILLTADLRGVDSHGIIRLNTYYGSRLKAGLVDPLTPFKVLQETPTTLAIDGGNGLGQVVSYHAMQRCIEKASASGLSMVTVRNSNHYGIAGYYAMMALKHDMIGISFTNSQPLVSPTYGCTAMLGTNPIAVAAPSAKEYPYVLDMATSIVPIGRITVFEKSGKPIPEGWGINKDGLVTTNPTEVLQGGALMPLGGTDIMRGYKGYGLGLLVDIFCGVLAGSGFATNVGHPSDKTRSSNVGHFFGAVKIDCFRPIDEFKTDMDRLIRQMKDSPKAVGKDRIYIHGEKEFELHDRYTKDGIPLLPNVVEGLRKDAAEIGVDFLPKPIGEIEV
jgi:L-2-hydroxycarboxylate dehydrogenase (NAD+)